jgi:hypothetical protein
MIRRFLTTFAASLALSACSAPQTPQEEYEAQIQNLVEEMRGDDAPNTGYSCESLDGSADNYRITTFVPRHLCACGIRLSVTEEDGVSQYEMFRGATTREQDDDTRLISTTTARLERAYERSSGRWQRIPESSERFQDEDDNFTGMFELFEGTFFRLTQRCVEELIYQSASSHERQTYIRQHYGR